MKDQSHKTAISRNKPSRPVRLLDEKGLLKGQAMDYGCGKSADADHYKMSKYDPHFFPVQLDKYDGTYDVITCTYVLNVVPVSSEGTILNNIKKLLKPAGKAYITVRRDIKKEGVTGKGTYQRNVELNLPILHEEKGRFCIYELTQT